MTTANIKENSSGSAHGCSGVNAWTPGGREAALAACSEAQTPWDLIVVGGGITGAGIYREAACRGLKVLLLEQQDFAWGTSSRSSKMVHGGLRYLGSGQFGLANDSVKERQNLLDQLPGLVEPLPFLMGHYKGGFPGPWIFDKLLAIYDWMAGRRFRKFIKQGISDFWVPGVRTQALKGMTRFADAVTDDARLVMRVLQDGNAQSGLALNYVRANETLTDNGRVTGLSVEDVLTGERHTFNAHAVVNATGAWTDTLRASLGQHKVIRPLRGSHLVVSQWRLPVAFSISFFHPKDKRPVFVFPWEGSTVIGTTDLDHRDDMRDEASISEEELNYLLEAANHQFDQAELSADDVLSTWSGVRPVVSIKQDQEPQDKEKQDQEVDLSKANNPSDEKREHAIWNDQGMISVAGGKLTTYRLIALEVLEEVSKSLATGSDGALKSRLSGDALDKPVPFEPLEQASNDRSRRLQGRYGSHAEQIELIDRSHQAESVFTTDTLWAELVWACRHESVVYLDDLLLRRTRLALVLGAKLDDYADQIKRLCCDELGWDDAQWAEQWSRYKSIMAKHYDLPKSVRSGSSEVAQ